MTSEPAVPALAVVLEQAEDEGLWFVARTSAEAYLQQELRRLHAAVENAAPSIAAASPGMVEALRDLIDAVQYRPVGKALHKARAALALATGQHHG